MFAFTFTLFFQARSLLYQFRLLPRIPCSLHDLCKLCGPGMWDSRYIPTVECSGEHPDSQSCPYGGTSTPQPSSPSPSSSPNSTPTPLLEGKRGFKKRDIFTFRKQSWGGRQILLHLNVPLLNQEFSVFSCAAMLNTALPECYFQRSVSHESGMEMVCCQTTEKLLSSLSRTDNHQRLCRSELLQVQGCCCWLGILPRALWAGGHTGVWGKWEEFLQTLIQGQKTWT